LRNVDDLALGFVGDPGIPLQLTFQLPFRPAGVTYKSSNMKALHLVHDRFGGREVGRVLQRFILLRPAQGGKGEVFGIDRTTQEDGHLRKVLVLLHG